jgi:hypothetical protein
MLIQGEEAVGEAEEEVEEDLEEEEEVFEEETKKAKTGTNQDSPVSTAVEGDTRPPFAQAKGCPEEMNERKETAKERTRKQLR